MEFDAFKVGQTIELNDGRTATVRYVGPSTFASGDWIGIELDDDSGKNDGSVQGERYFDCEAGHGMFLRAAGIQAILEEPTPRPVTKGPAGKNGPAAGPKGRPQSVLASTGIRRQNVMDPMAAKRQSMNAASPTPSAAARRQTVTNGTRPGATSGTSNASSAASSRGVTPTLARKPPTRTSMAPPSKSISSANTVTKPTTAAAAAIARHRPSGGPVATQRASSATSRAPPAAVKRLSPGISGRASASSTVESRFRAENSSRSSLHNEAEPDASEASDATSNAESTDAGSVSGEQEESRATEEVVGEPSGVPPALPSQAVAKKVEDPNATGRAVISRTTAAGRQIEELEAKLRLLERKRSEDQSKLTALDKLKSERDKFEKIIQTLQTKYGPQTQELATLRAKLKQAEDGAEKVDSVKAEHESMMEMATLDREMAEETAEALRAELEALKSKAVELELEVEVLREENEELGKEMSPEERNSQGWMQMERSNERMREALIRLRDVTQAQELEMKEQIAGLEDDLKQLEGLQQQFEAAKEQLARSEAAVENLKQQLDAALNAEEMVEDLTEANNNLSDEISKLRTEVDELQTINELNDEFEQQHVENEKQMQAEIDARGAALTERISHATRQEERMNDYVYTIAKFRELVTNLQTHLADMRASQQLTEAEAEDLNNRSKAMTDLNLRLQSSAAKTQSNTVDLEIRRLEAQEALEHLDIIQMFLPDGFKTERTSVLVYLRFKRVAFKANLLNRLLQDRVLNASIHSISERTFVYCDVMDKLAWVAAICERFVGDIRRCSLERFAGYETSLQELEPVERGMNAYIDAWKKDELREKVVAEELQRSTALLRHLAESQFVEDLPSYAEDISMRSKLMQSNLETAAAGLTCARTIIASASLRDADSSDGDTEDEPDGAVAGSLNYLETMIGQVRSAKVVAGKALGALSDLESRSMTFHPDTDELFAEALTGTEVLSQHAQLLGAQVVTLSEPGIEDEPLGARIRSVLTGFHSATYPEFQKPSTPLAGLIAQIRSVTDKVAAVLQFTGDITRSQEFQSMPAPWQLRAENLKAASVSNTATEQELFRLKEMMQDRLLQLRVRDQTIEEQGVRIELLESRTKDARERTQKIEDLQSKLDTGRKREAELMSALDKFAAEVEDLRNERDRLRRTIDARRPTAADDGRSSAKKSKVEEHVATAREMDALKLEIRSLQGTVEYLRRDNFEVKYADQSAAQHMSWLYEPLLKGRHPDALRAREKRDRLEQQSGQVVDALVQLVLNTQLVDLESLPENKLEWRPGAKKSSHLCLVNQQRWAHWHHKKERILETAGNTTQRPGT